MNDLTTPYGDPLLGTVLGALWRTALICTLSVGVATLSGLLMVTLWSASGKIMSEIIRIIVGMMDAVGPILPSLAILSSLQVKSEWITATLLGFLTWNVVAAFLRDETITLRKLPFIQAAVCLGLSPWKILYRHSIPHILPRFIPLMLGLFSSAAGLMGALGFLGIAGDASHSLGFMIFDAKSFVQQSPSYFVAAFVAFLILTVAPYVLILVFFPSKAREIRKQ